MYQQNIGLADGPTSDTLNTHVCHDAKTQMTNMGLLRNPLIVVDHKGNAIPAQFSCEYKRYLGIIPFEDKRRITLMQGG